MRLCPSHYTQVFGEIVGHNSLKLLRLIEAQGSASGKSRGKVGIAACGVVPEGAANRDESDSDSD